MTRMIVAIPKPARRGILLAALAITAACGDALAPAGGAADRTDGVVAASGAWGQLSIDGTLLNLTSGSSTEFWNGTGWESANIICQHPAWWGTFFASSWVGFPGHTCLTGLGDVTGRFRSTFTLPAGATVTSLQATWLADNSAQVYVNGSFIGGNVDDGTTSHFSLPTSANLTATTPFHTGTNAIEFVLRNWGSAFGYEPNPSGLLYTVHLIYKTPPLPTSVDDCKNGGWQSYGVFKNQGDCVSFVATKGKNPPAK